MTLRKIIKLFYNSSVKVQFNYSTIASTIQSFNYSGEGRGRPSRVRVGGEGVRGYWGGV